jgi:hypothetical protein
MIQKTDDGKRLILPIASRYIGRRDAKGELVVRVPDPWHSWLVEKYWLAR